MENICAKFIRYNFLMESSFWRKPILMTRTAIFLILFLIVASSAQPVPAAALSNHGQIFAGAKFYRTELYFGMNIPGGGTVSEEDWGKFLSDEVTPKFPDGFTVVESYGQYKDKSGAIVKEKSRVLVLLYPKKNRKDTGPKIEAIREAYKKAFRQESVLRLDFTQTVQVSF
jgi:hypothetical protein